MSGAPRAHAEAAGQKAPETKPILEVNPEHALVEAAEERADATRFDDWRTCCSTRRLLAEGGQLEDPAAFVRRVNALLGAAA